MISIPIWIRIIYYLMELGFADHTIMAKAPFSSTRLFLSQSDTCTHITQDYIDIQVQKELFSIQSRITNN